MLYYFVYGTIFLILVFVVINTIKTINEAMKFKKEKKKENFYIKKKLQYRKIIL